MQPDFLYAVGLSLLLGSLVGVERQWHRRLVDLKTNALVCLGACLFMLVTKTADGFADPIRMGGQIVVGVGFIGGGLLFRDGTQTKGINTAATLWCCAAVGTLCGLDRWMEAVSASLIIVLANTLLRQVAQFLNLKMGITDNLTSQVKFELTCADNVASAIREQAEAIFLSQSIDIKGVSEKTQNSQKTITLSVLIEHGDEAKQTDQILKKISQLPVSEASWSYLG
jgi:putative Mg2+ transporter-C (MgtC) family protein